MIRAISWLVKGVVDILQSATVGLAIFSIVYLFLFRPSVVQGASMQPNLHTGEKLITEKVSYQFGQPERGDIVVLSSPQRPDIDLVKRVIGLPGELIKIDGGQVYINDWALEEPYLNTPTSASTGNFLTDGQDFQIPVDDYFVMGDNRDNSSDSRTFGPINRSSIQGKAVFRYWPTNEFGTLPHPSY